MHQLLTLRCPLIYSLSIILPSMVNGCSRLFMFDLNNYQSLFVHIYMNLKECLLRGCANYNLFKKTLSEGSEEQNNKEDSSLIRNHCVVIRSELNEILLVVGKYFMYYESTYSQLSFNYRGKQFVKSCSKWTIIVHVLIWKSFNMCGFTNIMITSLQPCLLRKHWSLCQKFDQKKH